MRVGVVREGEAAGAVSVVSDAEVEVSAERGTFPYAWISWTLKCGHRVTVDRTRKNARRLVYRLKAPRCPSCGGTGAGAKTQITARTQSEAPVASTVTIGRPKLFRFRYYKTKAAKS